MKILVFAGFSKSLVHFRKELLEKMVKNGHEVIAIAPETGFENELAEMGVNFRLINFNRLSVNPINDIKLVVKLRNIIKLEKPEVFFGYTIKPVTYGAIVARLCRVKNVYSMVTGLGSMFIDDDSKKNKKRLFIRFIIKCLYYCGFRASTKVFFQNIDDLNEMVEMKLLKRNKAIVINGSGVNLETYERTQLPKRNVFLFVGSVMRDKGVLEYLASAEKVKEIYPDAEFWIVGPIDKRVSGLSYETIRPYIEKGIIRYFGEVNNVKEYLNNSRYYVLPSYREGTPRSVLEAMAKGRPIITTDAPGCRETVKDGVNGFLVPIKNVIELSNKMIWMIENPDIVEEMANKSYEIVKEKYDVNKVNSHMLTEMKLI